jgi:hypothetical protein
MCSVYYGCIINTHAVLSSVLYLQTWRALDRAYVDKTFNGQSWFKVSIIVKLVFLAYSVHCAEVHLLPHHIYYYYDKLPLVQPI